MSIGQKVAMSVSWLVRFVKESVKPEVASAGGERRSLLRRAIRVIHLMLTGYMEDDLVIHASSLTFVTLTSMVPVMTVAFAIAKGFGVGRNQMLRLEESEWLAQMPQQFQDFVTQMMQMVDSINVSALGGIGAGFFILTAILMLANIEKSFNKVWHVEKNRSLNRQITSYTSVLVLVPALLIVAGWLKARVAISEWTVTKQLGFDANAGGWADGAMWFLSVWVAIAFLYTLVPNTRVKLKPAFWGSLATTVVFGAWMKSFMVMQMGVASRSLIYGAFAAIPVFMFWLYITWVILLLGVEFTYVLQNVDSRYQEKGAAAASLRARVLAGILVVREAALAMENGDGRLHPGDFARKANISPHLAREVADALTATGHLVRVDELDAAYVLARRPDRLEVGDLVRDFMRYGRGFEGEGAAPGARELEERLNRGLREGFGSMTLAELCDEGGKAGGKAAAGSKERKK